MYQVIAPTLFQNKICRLPGIGTLVMVAHPAETDFVNSQIKSPCETIDFVAAVNDEKGFNEFSAISELLQKNLDENGSFFLNGIGNFTKDETGQISFVPIPVDPLFSHPVKAERVTRQEYPTHAILVGDHQTTNVEMNEYFKKPTLRDRWWVWAIVLALIGIGILLYYFYGHGFQGFGNLNSVN